MPLRSAIETILFRHLCSISARILIYAMLMQLCSPSIMQMREDIIVSALIGISSVCGGEDATYVSQTCMHRPYGFTPTILAWYASLQVPIDRLMQPYMQAFIRYVDYHRRHAASAAWP